MSFNSRDGKYYHRSLVVVLSQTFFDERSIFSRGKGVRDRNHKVAQFVDIETVGIQGQHFRHVEF